MLETEQRLSVEGSSNTETLGMNEADQLSEGEMPSYMC